jgi:hypothetical protein
MILTSTELPEVENKIQNFIQNANYFWHLSSKPIYYIDSIPNFRSCPDGRIFIGVNLLKETIKDDADFNTLYLYLSHEIAHQIQYMHQPHIFSTKTERQIELQADCLGCFYLGMNTNIYKSNFIKALKNLQSKADDRGSHGTSKQRYSSCRHGFKIGRYVKDNKIFLNTEDIFGSNGICR